MGWEREFGESGGEDGGAAPGYEAWDPGAAVWLPGVDYVGSWREAKQAADTVNAALAACGLGGSEARAVAVSEADGSASVRIWVTVAAARVLASVLSAA